MTRTVATVTQELEGPEAWQLAVMRAQGREEEAQAALDAINRFPIAFGRPPFAMPEPASVGLPNLCWCPAEGEIEPLTDVTRDIDPKSGNERVAA